MLTPNPSRTSALPHAPDMALLPCLATLTPAPAATKPAVVETLKVPDESPPVPQVSATGPAPSTRRDLSLITRAMPVISSTVSPLTRRAVTNAPNWAGVASPLMISSITWAACSSVREPPSASVDIASLITFSSVVLQDLDSGLRRNDGCRVRAPPGLPSRRCIARCPPPPDRSPEHGGCPRAAASGRRRSRCRSRGRDRRRPGRRSSRPRRGRV